jgi:hypothetical protein
VWTGRFTAPHSGVTARRRATLRRFANPAVVDADGIVFGVDGELITDAVGSGGDPVTICGKGDRIFKLTIDDGG